MSKKGFTLVELMIVVLVIGILAAIAIPNFLSLVARAREASTKKNMHLLQTATEDFAAVSGGRYPDDASSTSDDGMTLQQHIPNNVFPENPFTQSPAIVQFDADPTAGAQGELAFNPATVDSYKIKGTGADGTMMSLVLSNGH